MQTKIHTQLALKPEVQEADDILRSCVHCGFCTATCPSYQVLGDELDGPRGRIYLIKSMLEENTISPEATDHLDRCLSCRSCETTCPSGVEYGRLLDIGRGIIAENFAPKGRYKDRRALMLKWALRLVVPRQYLFTPLIKIGQFFKPLLPKVISTTIPQKRGVQNYHLTPVETQTTIRKVILLQGCVQKSATPNVNVAIEQILNAQGIEVQYLAEEGCCGALDYHLSAHAQGLARMKQMIDRIGSHLSDTDYIVSSASGCGVMVKDYPVALKHDQAYLAKAAAVSAKTCDVSELVARLNLSVKPSLSKLKIAVHTPCTLQHGQKLPNSIEVIFKNLGAELARTNDKHLCCGSAGTYSIMEPEVSSALAERKAVALETDQPDVIVTGNIGCQLQLDSAAKTKVVHWVELLAEHYA